jgi:hypothetical protein
MKRGIGIAVAASLICTQPAYGFGLRTHLYIGEQVLKDIESDCFVTVGTPPVEIEVPTDVCHSIRYNPGYFLAGAIGPDAFPDPIVGQTYVHPGDPQGRQTADWLDRMLTKADRKKPEQIAFAYGNTLHAAGDMFSHSYVNNYAGAVFAIGARWHKDVELRHSLIERYIDQRLPYSPEHRIDGMAGSSAGAVDLSQMDLAVPAELVVETMIKTSYVAGQVPVDEGLLWDLYKKPALTLGKMAAGKAAGTIPATHMGIMRRLLAIAERERQLAPCEEAKAVISMIRKYRAFVLLEYRARLETGQNPGARPFENVHLPKEHEAPVCEPADDRPEGWKELSEAEQRHRREIRQRKARTTAVQKLEYLNALFDSTRSASGMGASDLVANRRRTWWKQEVPEQLRREIAAAERDYEDSIRKRDRERALNVFLELWEDDVKNAIGAYMQASLDGAHAMIRSNAPSAPPRHDRQGSMDAYKRWFTCYRSVFRGAPAIGSDACLQRLSDMRSAMSLSSAVRRAAIGELPRDLLYALADFQHRLDEFMSEALLGLAGLVNPSIAGLVRMMTDPTRITRDQLDRRFRKARNGQLAFQCFSEWLDADMGLLPQTVHIKAGEVPSERPDTPCRTKVNGKWVYTEQPRKPGPFVPTDFIPIKHAITMSKLALLDEEGVKALAAAWGHSELPKTGPKGQFYSILLDMVRSIDGSYQWQGLSMPYPRQAAYSTDYKLDAGAGYPYRSLQQGRFRINFDKHNIKNRPGFPFYQTKTLRENVFAKLFPEVFEGEILRRREFNGAHYPFRPCEGDPFRKDGLGMGPGAKGAFQRVCETEETRAGSN